MKVAHLTDASGSPDLSIEFGAQRMGRRAHTRAASTPGGRLAHDWLWRRYARVYDALEHVVSYREMLDSVLAATGPVKGRAVVEVGCGTGNLLAQLVRDKPARLIGIDASAAMLERAGAKLDVHLDAGRIELHRSDAVAGLAAMPPGSVDVVVASNILYALPDRSAFWRAAGRVLASGGRIVLSNPDRPGVGPAFRQQWRTRGVRGFTDHRLPEVVLLNLVIDLLSATQRYEFASWATLVAEAEKAGLARAEFVGRCYGGPNEGMNVVGVFAAS